MFYVPSDYANLRVTLYSKTTTYRENLKTLTPDSEEFTSGSSNLDHGAQPRSILVVPFRRRGDASWRADRTTGRAFRAAAAVHRSRHPRHPSDEGRDSHVDPSLCVRVSDYGAVVGVREARGLGAAADGRRDGRREVEVG